MSRIYFGLGHCSGWGTFDRSSTIVAEDGSRHVERRPSRAAFDQCARNNTQGYCQWDTHQTQQLCHVIFGLYVRYYRHDCVSYHWWICHSNSILSAVPNGRRWFFVGPSSIVHGCHIRVSQYCQRMPHSFHCTVDYEIMDCVTILSIVNVLVVVVATGIPSGRRRSGVSGWCGTRLPTSRGIWYEYWIARCP